MNKIINQRFWIRFKRNKKAKIGLCILLIILILIIVGPFLYQININDYNLSLKNEAPSFSHPLGCDALGRDVLYRLLIGGRVSLIVAFLAMLVSVSISCIIGGISGYFKGFIDHLLMRVCDIVSSLPFIPFILVISYTMLWVDPTIKIFVVSLLIGLFSWTGLARLIRARVLLLKQQDFVVASQILGAKVSHIIRRHFIPNVSDIIVVNATLTMASALLIESGLSFLGMGVQAPMPSWGNMMELARDMETFQFYPWNWIFAGGLCLLTIISINLIGEGLKEIFDEREY